MIKFLIPVLLLFFAVLHFRRACLSSKLKYIAFGCAHLICGLGLLITFTLFDGFGKDIPIGRLLITGKKKQELVEWKTPSSSLQKRAVDVYEVLLETTKEELLGTYFLYGDLVSIRAKILRWHPCLNFLGFNNLCRIETISNSYRDVKAFNTGPHIAYEINLREWHGWVWAFWEAIYSTKLTSWLIKAATLESNEFPLTTMPRAYTLTISDGGLSATADL